MRRAELYTFAREVWTGRGILEAQVAVEAMTDAARPSLLFAKEDWTMGGAAL